MSLTSTASLLVPKLERTGLATQDYFQKLSTDEWHIQVYSDGPAWAVHNIFAHLTETEASIPRLIRNIVRGGAGVPEDFDIDRYNKKHVEEVSKLSRQELVAEHILRRNETITLTKQLTEDDFLKIGRHPFLGESQIVEMLKLMMLHSRVHERDVRKTLARSASN